MAKFKDYYRMLNVEPFADMETVKSSYRKLARKYHPDLNGGNKQAEERFKEINEAYDALNSEERKKIYDDSLKIMMHGRQGRAEPKGKAKARTKSQAKAKAAKSGEKRGKRGPSAKTGTGKSAKEGASDTTPINELFESFLKRSFTAEKQPKAKAGSGAKSDEKIFRKGKSRRGDDVTVETTITPLEAEQGVVKTVNVQHNEICRRCSGTGRVNGMVCTACHGEKTVARLKTLDVRIPPGVKDGSKVRVSGEGGRGGSGAENGDLFLLIRVSVNASLRIDGLDVYCDFPISVAEAVLGAEVDVPSLNGTVKMTVPPNTSSGKVFRLKQIGAKNGQNRGDQYVTVNIEIPDNLTPRERELFEELARIEKQKKRS